MMMMMMMVMMMMMLMLMMMLMHILPAIGLTPGGSKQYVTPLHTNNTHNTEKGKLGSAGRAPSL
jgi:hypothetical protein